MEDSTFDAENGKIGIPFVTKGIPISSFCGRLNAKCYNYLFACKYIQT